MAGEDGRGVVGRSQKEHDERVHKYSVERMEREALIDNLESQLTTLKAQLAEIVASDTKQMESDVNEIAKLKQQLAEKEEHGAWLAGLLGTAHAQRDNALANLESAEKILTYWAIHLNNESAQKYFKNKITKYEKLLEGSDVR
jgi:hypothetical protein